MNDTTSAIDLLDNDIKIPLSVQLIALYLRQGKKQSDIANLCNVSRQAVNDYIKKHYDELGPLTCKDDSLLALTALSTVNKAQKQLNKWLDKPSSAKQPAVLNNIISVGIDKYRLLTGQSTENVSIAVIELDAVK